MSSPHFGRRGCILADGWAALHRGDQREGDGGSEHFDAHARRAVSRHESQKENLKEKLESRNYGKYYAQLIR